VFEVRPASGANAAERVRREALRAVLHGDIDEAERAVNSLLQLNANSVDAYFVRERIARVRGLTAEAERHGDTARAMLRGKRDKLLEQFARPGSVDETPDDLGKDRF
jgi:hypothetical protein